MAHRKPISNDFGALAAVGFMRFLGYHDAQPSNPVIPSSEALALLHPGPSKAGVRQVEWITVLAAKLNKQPLVLSLVGFSRCAVDLAEKTAVATFTLKNSKPVSGGDSLGRTLLRNAECRARGELPPPLGLTEA